MNNDQFCELTALPKLSTSHVTAITIPAENSSTTNNNNGKVKKIISLVDSMISQNSVKNFRFRAKRSILVSSFWMPSIHVALLLVVRFLVFHFPSQ